jgi:F-type H+-transporting ATP synthase subunit e
VRLPSFIFQKVVRYTALASGILYGIVHRRTLTAREQANHEKDEDHRRRKLLKRAREAWKEKTSPSTGTRVTISKLRFGPILTDIYVSSLIVITDPENPKFDLEALVAAYDKQ